MKSYFEENKILEKKIRKYVIVTEDGLYLRKDVLNGTYDFVEDIEAASKMRTYATAAAFLKYYYLDTKDNIELGIVPLDVSFELVFDKELCEECDT